MKFVLVALASLLLSASHCACIAGSQALLPSLLFCTHFECLCRKIGPELQEHGPLQFWYQLCSLSGVLISSCSAAGPSG